MKSKIIMTTVGLLTLASFALPAFARTDENNQGTTSSSTAREIRSESDGGATGTANRVENLQNRGSREIDVRVSSLNRLLGRIQEMNKITDAQRTSFVGDIQDEISTMSDLRDRIASSTGTTTLKEDVQSITRAYRVYALIMPRINVVAAADRINTLADMLTTVAGKLQTRLASTSSSTDATALQANLTDMTAKIADARAQAKAAIDEVTALQPDNGVKSVMESNTSALKDARTKIQTAQKDLVAARKDAQTITNALRKGGRIATSTKASSTRE